MTRPPRASGRGVFITFEGPEGAGKTSQAAMLSDVATGAGLEVLVTREPGGTPIGERIRDLLLAPAPGRSPSRAPSSVDARTDALLFNAARAQLVAYVIEPALGRGRLVIATRFADSTLAYQGFGEGLPLTELRILEHFATGGLKPDLTILLDLPSEVGLGRKTGVEVTRFESAFDIDFHRRVRDGFLALAAAEPERFAVVNAAEAPDVVFEQVLGAARRLPDLERSLPTRSGDPVAHTRASGEPEPRAVRIQR